jgi:lipoprotein signal peptidase
MTRLRTAAAAAIFLFGTTFLWFMPSFLRTGTTVEGASWSVIQVLVLATVVSYAGAAWGLYKARAWWRPVTTGASILGAVVLPLWWIAASSITGVTNIAANLALHAVGIAVLLVPSLARSLDRRLATHP